MIMDLIFIFIAFVIGAVVGVFLGMKHKKDIQAMYDEIQSAETSIHDKIEMIEEKLDLDFLSSDEDETQSENESTSKTKTQSKTTKSKKSQGATSEYKKKVDREGSK